MIHPTPCLACVSFSILTTMWLHFMACGAMTDPTTSETSPPAKDTWTSLNVLWELETMESKDCETMINTLPERILLLIRTFAHVEQASFQKDVRTVVSIVENLARLRNIRSSNFRTDLDMVVRTLQLVATDAGYPNQDNTAATAAKMSDSYPGLLPFDERIDAPPAADAYEPGFLDVYFQRMQAVVVLIRSRIIPLLFTRWIAYSSWLDVTQLCIITLNSYSLVNWFIPFTRHKKRPFSLEEDRLSLTFDGSESWKYLIRALEVLVGEARDALNKSLSSLSGENAFQFYASPPALSDLEQFIESTKSVADKDDSFLQVLHFFLQWSAYYRSLFRTALRYRAQSLIRTLRDVENEHQQQKLESILGDLQTMEHEVCVTKIHLKYLQKETPTTAPAPSSSARDVAYLAKVLSFFAFPLTFSRPTKPIESIDGNDPPKTPLDTDIHTQQLLLERQRVSLVLAILIAISGLIFFSLCTFMILIPSNNHSLTFQSDANEYKPENELREINDEEHTHPAMPENLDRGFQFPENPRLLII